MYVYINQESFVTLFGCSSCTLICWRQYDIYSKNPDILFTFRLSNKKKNTSSTVFSSYFIFFIIVWIFLLSSFALRFSLFRDVTFWMTESSGAFCLPRWENISPFFMVKSGVEFHHPRISWLCGKWRTECPVNI